MACGTKRLLAFNLSLFLALSGRAYNASTALTSVAADSTHCSSLAGFPKKFDASDKIYALGLLWSELKYNFAFADRLDFDLDSLYLVTLDKVLATENDIECFDEFDKFLSSMNDGHTRIVEYPYDWRDYYDYAPVTYKEIDGRIYVSEIGVGCGLDSTYLSAELTHIDGIPTSEYIRQRLFPLICASNDATRWMVVPSQIDMGYKGGYFTGRYRKKNGEEVSVKLLLDGMARPPSRYWTWGHGSLKKRRSHTVTLEWPERKIALLDIRGFRDEAIRSLDSLLPVVARKADGLIIDLRYNSGGNSEVGSHLQKYLTPSGWFLTAGWQTRTHNAYGRSQGNYVPAYEAYFTGTAYETRAPDTIRTDGVTPLTCPVVILIGTRTASAAETFLVALYEAPQRPLLVGKGTQGSTGAPLVIDLPHGSAATICTRRLLFPYSGKLFYGNGIKPDIEVKPTLQDYEQGRDAALEKALALLKEKIKRL